MSPTNDNEDRIRRVEEAIIRFGEWAKIWDSLPTRVAALEQEKTAIWAAIGQFKVKQGLIWAVIAGAASLIAGFVSAWISAKMSGGH